MDEKVKKDLRDRFAAVRKHFLDWYGQSEPHWDKESEDKTAFVELLERWERILKNRPTSFPSVHDQHAFLRFEDRAKREGIIT